MGKFIMAALIVWPLAGAFISYLTGLKNKKLRNIFVIGITFIQLVFAVMLYKEVDTAFLCIEMVMGFGINLTLSGFRYVYIVLTCLGWFLASVFGMEYFAHYRNRNRYYFFMLITLSATSGVFLSADLVTTFIFFEIMSLSSFALVAHEEKLKTKEAANVYLYISVLSGLVLLFGILMLYSMLGTVEINEIYAAASAYENKNKIYAACALMAFGFATKAGTFPMHVWLPKAHPVAPAPASALLSGIMIKTGFFGMLILSCEVLRYDALWGNILLAFGLATMLLGALLALFSVDIKRTLACSSVSQSGFITTGIAMQCILGHHNALAAYGTSLHMVNHTLVKLALFMAAGIIYLNTHELNLNEIKGYGRNKPLLFLVFALGGLSLMGIPGTSGYISKTMLHESIVEQIVIAAGSGLEWYYRLSEYVFLFTGGLTAAYMLKVFVAVFIQKPSSDSIQSFSNRKYIRPLSAVSIAAPALMLVVFGVMPKKLYEKIGEACLSFMHADVLSHEIHYLSFICLKGVIISVAIGLVVYFGIVRTLLVKKYSESRSYYINALPEWTDIELEFYRPLATKIIPMILSVICRFLDRLVDSIAALGILLYRFLKNEVYFTSSQKEGTNSHAVGQNAMLDTVTSSLLMFSAGLLVVLLCMILS